MKKLMLLLPVFIVGAFSYLIVAPQGEDAVIGVCVATLILGMVWGAAWSKELRGP